MVCSGGFTVPPGSTTHHNYHQTGDQQPGQVVLGPDFHHPTDRTSPPHHCTCPTFTTHHHHTTPGTHRVTCHTTPAHTCLFTWDSFSRGSSLPPHPVRPSHSFPPQLDLPLQPPSRPQFHCIHCHPPLFPTHTHLHTEHTTPSPQPTTAATPTPAPPPHTDPGSHTPATPWFPLTNSTFHYCCLTLQVPLTSWEMSKEIKWKEEMPLNNQPV